MKQRKPSRRFKHPKTVPVAGKRYPIRWDTESAMALGTYIEKNSGSNREFLDGALNIMYPTVPEDRGSALEAMLRFYLGGSFPEDGYFAPLMSEAQWKQYRKCEIVRGRGDPGKKHWWEFRTEYERGETWY